ncbi:DUF748 domain-containing protein [Azoarcus sp. KH32C]|uniref:DUF748 domain-containing protein n=1 Tax=Azoarcus sp. KH32C TaxID=748247 RepID=UPI0005A02AB0|nr:DUF748 domain-containing protein [Azoarcus sp. KH32C]
MSAWRLRGRSARRALWAACIGALLAVLYALAGFLVLPWLIERELPAGIHERFGLSLNIAAVHANPFLLSVVADDVVLARPDGTPLLSARRARVDLDSVGALTRRWTIGAIELEGAMLELVLGEDGRLELPEVTPARSESEPPASPHELPALLLRKLELRDGSVILRQRGVPSGLIALQAIQIEANALSTVADAPPAQYRLAAGLPGGGSLKAEGELGMGARSASGRLSIEDALVEPWWPLFERRWGLASPGGRLSFGARYRAGRAAGAADVMLDGLTLHADGLRVARADAAQTEPPLAAIRHIDVADGSLELASRRVQLKGLRLADGTASATVDAEGRIDWAGLRRATSDKSDKDAPWRVEMPAATLEDIALHYRELAEPGRRFDAERAEAHGDLVLDGAKGGLHADALATSLAKPSYAAGDAAPVVAERIELAGGKLDTAAREIVAERVTLEKTALDFVVDTEGRLKLPGGFAGAKEGVKPETAGHEAPAPNRWNYSIGELVARGVDVSLDDRRADTPLALRGSGEARISGLTSRRAEPFAFEARMKLVSGGELRVDGHATLDGKGAEAHVQLADVNLAPAAPLLQRHTTLRLAGGSLGSDIRLRRSGAEPPQISAEGSARISGLRLDEADSGTSLFSARQVSAEGRWQLAPPSLLLTKVVLDGPDARLIVDQNRELNLADLLRKRRAAREPEKARTGAEPPALALRIERIEVRDGAVDFADNSLVLPFSTRVQSVAGNVLGVDNRPRSEAVVDIGGGIEPHGEAHARGRIRPFAPGELTDLSVSFDNVEMPQLSPYSATFAGRTIAAGRLWLDVAYRVFDRQLDGNNAVTLEDFVLGERVEAPNARDLPLELAVALLKDSKGRVHLEVPVRGNVGDAHFEYRRLVADALGNVLERVVTAPFRLLARLVGRGEDDTLQAIDFEPGSARLSAEEEEKLLQLAHALGERPQLVLTLHGGYLVGRDEEALRIERTRRDIATAAGQKPGEGPVGELDFGDTAIRGTVARRYETVAGSDALAAFRRDFARRNPKGGETALHRELFDRLVEHEPLPAPALGELARQRTAVVLNYLRDHGVDGGRLKSAEPVAVDRGDPRVELALEAS